MSLSLLSQAVLLASHSGSSDPLNPVILVPGLAGSRFRARLDGTSEPHFFCSKHDSWYTIWVNAAELVPGNKDCLLHNLELHFNASTGEYSNTTGVELDTNVGSISFVSCGSLTLPSI